MPKPILVTTSSFSASSPQPKEELLRQGLEVHENPHKRKLTEDEVLSLLRGLRPVGMIAGLEPLTARVLQEAKGHLRVISRCGTGLENVDLSAAEGCGIRVFNTPEAPSQAVAELAVGLMLAVLRRIAEADRALRAGTWKALPGSLLGDKTVGIVGLGRIGSRVLSICRGFGCQGLTHDAAPIRAEGARSVSLDELIANSDVVSLHCPLAPATRGLIGGPALARMRKGAVLINTSRGGLIDEAALQEALAAGRLAGAGLDVFESEPYTGPLLGLPNVVLTPHMGSGAKECRVRMESEASDNLIKGLRAAGEL